LSPEARDKIEAKNLLTVLESEIIPMYYTKPEKWVSIVKTGMTDVAPMFDSGRMVKEYYEELYS
jgi:starch phosphorylase